TPLEKLFEGEKLFLSQRLWTASGQCNFGLAAAVRSKQRDPTADPSEIFHRLIGFSSGWKLAVFSILNRSLLFVWRPTTGAVVSIIRFSQSSMEFGRQLPLPIVASFTTSVGLFFLGTGVIYQQAMIISWGLAFLVLAGIILFIHFTPTAAFLTDAISIG